MVQYRQGDVLLKRVRKIEGKATGASGRIVLAEGETTGHAHVLSGKVREYRTSGGQVMVEVEEPARLLHEEHAEVSVPVGAYAVIRQREFTAKQAVRSVMD